MKIHSLYNLSSLNSLSIPSVAASYCQLSELSQISEIVELAKKMNLPIRVLGGGSNLILGDNVEALVVHNKLLGNKIIEDNPECFLVEVMAGENWHLTVEWAVKNNYFGIENLALIPGTVGAAPVQNIGAYGREIADTILSVSGFDFHEHKYFTFSNDECKFDYRSSIFKSFENRFLITSVTLKLNKIFSPFIHYGPLQQLSSISGLSAIDVYHKVIETRNEKLPDPKLIPNAGSFFKNPIISAFDHSTLIMRHPNLVSFPHGNEYKLAAGWLIDQCGLKGKSNTYGVGCYKHQALVLINRKSVV